MNDSPLNEIVDKVKYNNGNYFIFGGYNLILHDIDLNDIEHSENDIDICCNSDTYFRLENYFKELKSIPQAKDPHDNSYKQFQIINYKYFNFDIMCEIDGNYYKKYLKNNYIEIKHGIPCLKLLPQAIGYLEVFHDKNFKNPIPKVIKILNYLNKNEPQIQNP